MCGIAGFIAATRLNAMELTGAQMADALVHRGPDDGGVWIDRDAGVCLAHRRLAILDLSAAGHQPMTSSGDRFVISYNGEIYNHHEIRAEIQAFGFGVRWRGHSDTETLLAAFETWGVEGALERAVGMFAIALWDRAERRLTLAATVSAKSRSTTAGLAKGAIVRLCLEANSGRFAPIEGL